MTSKETISTDQLREWFAHFAISRLAKGVKPRTVEWYRERFNVYLEWIDARNGAVGPLDTIALEYFMAEKRQENAPSTVASNYRTIAIVFNWLVRRGYISERQSPTKTVEKPNVPKRRPKHVTQEQFERLYRSIPGQTWMQWRDRCLLLILYYSGLRANEVLSLHVNDIDRREKLIHVREGKGDKDRAVPYVPELDEALDRYLSGRPPCNGIKELFVATDGYEGVKGPLLYEGFVQMMRRRCKKAGMPKLNLHGFRHAFAMWSLNNGADMSSVAAMMGHSSVKITEEFYARWVTNGLRREYHEALNRYRGADGVQI